MSRLIMKKVVKHKPLKLGMMAKGMPINEIEVEEVEYEERVEAQELFCTECGKYVRFPINLALDGNHEVTCPNCGHVHYRVVVKGIITEDRYSPCPGMMTYQVATYQTTSSATSYYQDMNSTNTYMTQAWTDSATTCA